MAMEKIKEMFEAHPYIFMITVTSVVSSVCGIFGRKQAIEITNQYDFEKLAEALKERAQ